MVEKYKHKIVIGCEILLLCMMIGVLGTNAASSNPPSNGVSYSKNSQTTVEGALNDLYTKVNYGDATAAQILKGKKALVGGKQVTGTYEAPTLTSQTKDATAGAGDILKDKTAYVNGSKITGTMANKGAVTGTVNPGGSYTIPAGYHNGSGKATCATCESKGYNKFWKFQKDATYTRNSTGTDTTLQNGRYIRLCNDNKNCTYTFTIPLDSGISVNKLHSCAVELNGGNVGDFVSQWNTIGTRSFFRFNRGYSSNSSSGTQQYWYTDSIKTFNIFDNHNGNWESWTNTRGDHYLNTRSAASTLQEENEIYVDCGVKDGKVYMTLEIDDNSLAVYGNKFSMAGSITYQ